MTSTNTPHSPRVRLIVVTTTGEIMNALDLDALIPSQSASKTLPVNTIFNPPHWPLLATIATGVLPSRHHVYTPLAYDQDSDSLAVRRSDAASIPWIWDRVTAAGRSAAVVNCPLVKAGDGDTRFLLDSAGPRKPCTIDSVIEATRQGLEADLLVSFADFRPQQARGSAVKPMDPDQVQQDIKSLLEAARPTGPDDHLLVFLQPRHRAKLLLIGPRAADATVKSLRSIDVTPTSLNLLTLPITSDLPGRSIFTQDDDENESHWPELTPDACDDDIPEMVLQQIESGNDALRPHAIAALSTAWICHMRIHGLRGSLQLQRSQLLVELQGNAMDWFRLANTAFLNHEDELLQASLAHLREHHDGTMEADLADLIQLEDVDPDVINHALDAHAPEQMSPLLRRTWARAALEVDRTETAISHLQHMVSLGVTPSADRLLLCRLMLDQDRPEEAIRALAYLGSSPDQPIPTQLLRAEALRRHDKVDQARNLLERLLEAHPGQVDATAMLNAIDSGDAH